MASVAHNSGGQSPDRLDPTEFGLAAGMVVVEGGSGGGGGAAGALDITASQKMLSAVSGSLLTSLLVTPLDVVRVRLQSQRAPIPSVDFSKLARTPSTLSPAQSSELGVTACCREVFFAGNPPADYCIAAPRVGGVAPKATAAPPADCVVEEVQRRTYSSTYDGLRKIARNEGVTTLWRGLSPTLLMTVPANIIYFTGYDWLRHNSTSPFSRMSDEWAPLTAGSVARVLAAAAVSPIELVRTRMQAATGESSSVLVETFQGVREMIGTHGYVSLWRGLTLTLWRDVPFSGLYWWGYETIRGRLTDLRDRRRGRTVSRDGTERRRSQSEENHSDTFVDSFVSGATSGAFASLVTTPFDVGKTRTQVYRDAPSGAASSAAAQIPEERHMVRLLWHIFKTEGIPGLWKGWIPRTLKVAPACAIMISSYEVSKRAFRGVNEQAMDKRKAGE